MAEFFLRIYDRLRCRKGLAALIVVLIAALCTLSLCRLHYEEDIAGFLPIDRSDSRQTEFMETVSQQNSIAVIHDRIIKTIHQKHWWAVLRHMTL